MRKAACERGPGFFAKTADRATSPKISAFPVRGGELRVGSGKFPKKGVISVGSVDRRSRLACS